MADRKVKELKEIQTLPTRRWSGIPNALLIAMRPDWLMEVHSSHNRRMELGSFL
jgi:hypothetical protein